LPGGASRRSWTVLGCVSDHDTRITKSHSDGNGWKPVRIVGNLTAFLGELCLNATVVDASNFEQDLMLE
jgi:hypothetical protein